MTAIAGQEFVAGWTFGVSWSGVRAGVGDRRPAARTYQIYLVALKNVVSF